MNLYLFEVPLAFPEGVHAVSSMGSVFHGALMEQLPAEVAAHLHAEELRPYHQSILFTRERGAVWRFGVLDEGLFCLLWYVFSELAAIELRQKGFSVALGEPRLLQATSEEALADAAFAGDEVLRSAACQFLTPTSSKRDGVYQMFPDTQLILQSLLGRWRSFSERVRLDEPDLAERLAPACRISSYRLQSAPFSLERHTIYGFRGQLRFYFAGNDMVRRIFRLLFSFAPFAGVGIKTALGMGAVDVFWKE